MVFIFNEFQNISKALSLYNLMLFLERKIDSIGTIELQFWNLSILINL